MNLRISCQRSDLYSPEDLALCSLACCGDTYNEAYFRLMRMPLSELLLHFNRYRKLQELRNPRNAPQDVKAGKAVNLSTRITPAHRQAIAQMEAADAFNLNNYDWKPLH